MGVIKTASGDTVTIGSFASGYPRQTTSGATIAAVDPGVPLANYSPVPTDPMHLWKTQPSLRKVVGFAARQIGSVPWQAFQRIDDNDRRRVSDSTAETVFERPSRFRTGYNLFETLAIDAMIYDLFCAVLIDGELVRIPPKRIAIASDWLGRATKITLLTPADMDDIDITDAPMMISWGWSASSAGGVSPMYTLSQILAEARQAVEWRNQLWSRSPKFNGILKHPGSFRDPQKRERFTQSWRQWRDSEAGGTPILEDGMEYEVLDSFTPRDAKDIEGRILTDAEVASAFHIPPELVGARPGNFSNIAAFRQMLFGPTLGPLFQAMQQAANTGLVEHLDPRPGVYVEANLQAAMAGSFLEQAQLFQTSVGGPTMTRAEARARMNLRFIEGTDELIVPMNVTEGGLASPNDTGSQNRGPQPEVQQARRMITRTLRKAEDPGDLGSRDDQRDQLTAALQTVLANITAAVEADGIGDPDAFHEAWDQAMAAAFQAGVTTAALSAAWTVLRQHNPGAEGWAPEVMDAYLAEMAANMAVRINEGVITAVADAEDQEPADGQEPPPVAERRRSALDAFTNTAALAWAGSAIAGAAGFGGHDAAKASGLRKKTWRVESSHPRKSHARMNGQTRDIDKKFSNGARWPGDAVNLSVDELAGCTCGVEFTTE